MARTTLDDDAEDALFRIFDAAQGAERRIFRIVARGFFNEHALLELRSQLQGALDNLAELEKRAGDAG